MATDLHQTLAEIWATLGGAPDWPGRLRITGVGDLPSVFPVTDLAVAAIGAAGLAVAELIAARHPAPDTVTVDRGLASAWFGWSFRPLGWKMPAPWDAVAGDYQTADGWIRLHTNAPHHRAAALAVIGAPEDRAAVADALRRWPAEKLETAIVAAGGCAAEMRSLDAWQNHPQGRAVAAEPLLWREPGAAGAAPTWPLPADRPLQGVRVLDMTRVLAGPIATRFLAGYGAEVLRIDPPGWDEPGVIPEVTLGKSCARLDLRAPADRAIWEQLLRTTDVLVHGYRPGALDGLGLGIARRRELCPALIDVSLCAYGWSGPWQARRGFDSLLQMSTGIAESGMRTWQRDKPTPLPVQALDHATGYLMAASAIRGLTHRLATGTGLTMRASLARTAALLTNMTPGNAGALAPEQPDDLTDAIENTPWGPAQRIRPPLVVSGATMRWDKPAAALGSAPASWVSSRPEPK